MKIFSGQYWAEPGAYEAEVLGQCHPPEWHREHQIVYVKAELWKVAGRISGGLAI